MPTSQCQRPARRVAFFLVATLALHSPPAAAQAENEAAARALFEDARRLIKEGNYTGACPKLEAAAKIQAGPGVLLNLGDCYEHTNRTASAWTEFAEAASMATRAGRTEQAEEANRRKSLLDPKLSRLLVRVTEDVPGLAILRDGASIDRTAWGASLPVDPGEHTVTASAAGWLSWSASVRIVEPGDVLVEIPRLQAPPQEPATRTVEANRPAFVWTPPRIAGTGAVGAGVVGMGIAGVLTILAKTESNRAEQESGDNQKADSATAVRDGNFATAFVIGGGVLTVAGIVLWLAAPAMHARVTANGPPWVLGGSF